MKIKNNIAILIAGSLAATAPLFAKDGFDDRSSPSSTSGTSDKSDTSGDIDPRKKVVANFGERLLVVPCIDVRDSAFDGHYNVLMSLAGDGSGFDWKLKRAEVTTDPVCDYSFDNEIDTDDVLAAIGMPSVSVFKGKDGTGKTLEVTIDYDLRKKVMVSFSNNMLVVPCVHVQQTIFAGHYDIVMEGNPNNVEEWKVREAKPTTCDGESAKEINLEITLDEVLQSINMKK